MLKHDCTQSQAFAQVDAMANSLPQTAGERLQKRPTSIGFLQKQGFSPSSTTRARIQRLILALLPLGPQAPRSANPQGPPCLYHQQRYTLAFHLFRPQAYSPGPFFPVP